MLDHTVPIVGTMTHEYATAAGHTVHRRDCRAFERALCRVLIANGFSGRLDLHDAASGMLRLSFADMATAGLRDAIETDARGPHYVKHREFDFRAVRAA